MIDKLEDFLENNDLYVSYVEKIYNFSYKKQFHFLPKEKDYKESEKHIEIKKEFLQGIEYKLIVEKDLFFRWIDYLLIKNPEENIVNYIYKYTKGFDRKNDYGGEQEGFNDSLIKTFKRYQPSYIKLLSNKIFFSTNRQQMITLLDDIYSQDNKLLIIDQMIKSPGFSNVTYQKDIKLIIDKHVKNKKRYEGICYKIFEVNEEKISKQESGSYLKLIYNTEEIGMLNLKLTDRKIGSLILDIKELLSIKDKLNISDILTVKTSNNKTYEIIIFGESLNNELIKKIADEYLKQTLQLPYAKVDLEKLYTESLYNNLTKDLIQKNKNLNNYKKQKI